MEKIEKKYFVMIVVVTITLFILTIIGVYKCPFSYFLGIPCPTCGLTRSFLALMHFNIGEAFYYYALWPIVIIVIIGFLLIQFGLIKISKKSLNIIIICLIVIVLAYYIYRHLIGSPIVRIDFNNSLIYRIISIFR